MGIIPKTIWFWINDWDINATSLAMSIVIFGRKGCDRRGNVLVYQADISNHVPDIIVTGKVLRYWKHRNSKTRKYASYHLLNDLRLVRIAYISLLKFSNFSVRWARVMWLTKHVGYIIRRSLRLITLQIRQLVVLASTFYLYFDFLFSCIFDCRKNGGIYTLYPTRVVRALKNIPNITGKKNFSTWPWNRRWNRVSIDLSPNTSGIWSKQLMTSVIKHWKVADDISN